MNGVLAFEYDSRARCGLRLFNVRACDVGCDFYELENRVTSTLEAALRLRQHARERRGRAPAFETSAMEVTPEGPSAMS